MIPVWIINENLTIIQVEHYIEEQKWFDKHNEQRQKKAMQTASSSTLAPVEEYGWLNSHTEAKVSLVNDKDLSQCQPKPMVPHSQIMNVENANSNQTEPENGAIHATTQSSDDYDSDAEAERMDVEHDNQESDSDSPSSSNALKNKTYTCLYCSTNGLTTSYYAASESSLVGLKGKPSTLEVALAHLKARYVSILHVCPHGPRFPLSFVLSVVLLTYRYCSS